MTSPQEETSEAARDGRKQTTRRNYRALKGSQGDAPTSGWSTAPLAQKDEQLLANGPYVGARPFTAAESVLLAGRAKEADELANMVVAGTLTVVYGASGVGKSSLLNAKLPERLDPMDPGWGQRTVAFSRWQPGFYNDLQKATAPFADGRDTRPGSLAATLLAAVQDRDCPLTLIFDQFEEYFLYHPNGDTDFAPELARLANMRDSQIHIILSLRSDGLFLLDRLRLRIPDIFRRLYQVQPLSEEGARDAIVEPLKRYNEAAERSGKPLVVVPERDGPVVNALVTGSGDLRIRAVLGRGKGTGSASTDAVRVVAPFLQLALLKLWVNTAGRAEANRPIDVAPLVYLARRGSGGRIQEPADAVGRIMQNHVARVLQSFADVSKQGIRTTLFNRMIMSEDGKARTTTAAFDVHDDIVTAARDFDDPSNAVGRLMQGHVAQILHTFADVNTQRICAAIFRRMVTSEGGKVAVTAATSATGLSASDRGIAAQVLDHLASMSGEERLIRVAGDIDGHKTFEVQHDALGILLLDWVERWEQEESVRRYGAKLMRIGKFVVAGVMLAAILVCYNQYAAKRDIVAQAERFVKSPAAIGYREPVLTLLAALDDAEGIWTRLGLVDTRTLQDMVRQILRRAPRWGGAAAAVGIDDAGTRFALVGILNRAVPRADRANGAISTVSDNVGATGTANTVGASGTPNTRPPVTSMVYSLRKQDQSGARCPRPDSPPIAVTAATGRPSMTSGAAVISGPPVFATQGLMFQPNSRYFPGNEAGYVLAGSCPVLLAYETGIIDYWTAEESGWHETTLDKLVPNLPGQIWTEMLRGALQVRLINQSDRTMRTASITGGADVATEALTGGDFKSSFSFSLFPPPVFSPANDYIEWFEEFPADRKPRQPAGPVLTLRGSGEANHDQHVRIAEPTVEYDSVYPDTYYRSLAATFVVKDGLTTAVLRTPTEVRLIQPIDGKSMVFAIPSAFPSAVEAQPWYPAPLAATWEEDGSRFAWMTNRGIAVLDGPSPSKLLNGSKNVLHPTLSSNQLLITSIRDGMRLRLSEDGQVLSLLRAHQPGRPERMELWDLSKSWADQLNDTELSLTNPESELRIEACRIAAIEEGGNQLRLDEMDTVFRRIVAQPCDKSRSSSER